MYCYFYLFLTGEDDGVHNYYLFNLSWRVENDRVRRDEKEKVVVEAIDNRRGRLQFNYKP